MEKSPEAMAQEVLDRIVAEQDRYDQGTWQTILADDVVFPKGENKTFVGCQSTGCVAGSADTGLGLAKFSACCGLERATRWREFPKRTRRGAR